MLASTTIVAVASPPGGGERGVVRISGPRAGELLRATCAGELRLAERAAFSARFRDGRGEQPVFVLWMPGPRSFTREDVAELHLPGAPPLLEAALRRLVALGAEPAAPGEFTRRAFLNGRIDLSRAEGVLALVSARSDAERRAATALLFGGLERRTADLRAELAELRALCEASLDFDEADTGHVPVRELEAAAARIAEQLGDARAWEARRAAPLGEPRVVLAGRANAGKSSLFNRLAGSDDRALVSDVPGTTRDAKAAIWRPGGTACRLIDTAGSGAVEGDLARRAMERASAEQRAADGVLWVADATLDPRPDASRLAALGESGAFTLLVWNQIDRPGARPSPPPELAAGLEWVATSALTGEGLGPLAERVGARLSAAPEPGPARELSERHRAAFALCSREVAAARAALRAGAPLDQVAAHLSQATSALDGITGRTVPEDVLERIFARFCIGK